MLPPRLRDFRLTKVAVKASGMVPVCLLYPSWRFPRLVGRAFRMVPRVPVSMLVPRSRYSRLTKAERSGMLPLRLKNQSHSSVTHLWIECMSPSQCIPSHGPYKLLHGFVTSLHLPKVVLTHIHPAPLMASRRSSRACLPAAMHGGGSVPRW